MAGRFVNEKKQSLLIDAMIKYKKNFSDNNIEVSIGDNVNKSIAVKKTLNVLSNYQDFKDVITIGIGDSPNDLEMLDYVDFPCHIKNKNNQNL